MSGDRKSAEPAAGSEPRDNSLDGQVLQGRTRCPLFLSRLAPLLLAVTLFSCAGCSSRRGSTEPAGALYPAEILSAAERQQEVAEKVRRVAGFLEREGVKAVVGRSQAFARWITGGTNPWAVLPAQNSPLWIVVRDDGRRYVLGPSPEVRWLRSGELGQLGFEFRTWSPIGEAGPFPRPNDVIQEVVPSLDFMFDDNPGVAELRTPLVEADVRKYRWLGRSCAEAVEEVCSALRPYATEKGIEVWVSDALRRRAIEPVRILVSADDRLEQCGLAPAADKQKCERRVLIGVTAHRWGLHVSLARTVSFGPIDDKIRQDLQAAARIDAGMWARTVPNGQAADLVEGVDIDCLEIGRENEPAQHWLGGATGYLEFEWLAVPGSKEVIRSGRPYVWQASSGGVTLMDTVMLAGDNFEVLTQTRDWPRVEAKALGRIYRLPSILVR